MYSLGDLKLEKLQQFLDWVIFPWLESSRWLHVGTYVLSVYK